jgi:uncharacterized damage-inducible protein DinB
MTPADLFLDRSRYYLRVEYRIKLRRAVEALPPEALWWRPNEQSNSVGNLLLHLAGNVRQWIVAGVGGAPNIRDRAAEFAAREGDTGRALLERLEAVVDEADAVIGRLGPADLVERRTIQGREMTALEAIYHVVEHFAMHAGQIFFMTKERVPGAIRFYEDAGGLARPVWQDSRQRP